MTVGLQRKTVRVVPYSETWPQVFADERDRILQRIGQDKVPIEHVGSTSVPGLSAKPIIDIALSVQSILQTVTWPEKFAPEYRHYGNRALPDDWLYIKGPERCRQVYLHIVLLHSQRWRNYLHFRDQLRTKPDLREAYTALKNELSRRYPKDREAYTQGKADFIQQILKSAPQSP